MQNYAITSPCSRRKAELRHRAKSPGVYMRQITNGSYFECLEVTNPGRSLRNVRNVDGNTGLLWGRLRGLFRGAVYGQAGEAEDGSCSRPYDKIIPSSLEISGIALFDVEGRGPEVIDSSLKCAYSADGHGCLAAGKGSGL